MFTVALGPQLLDHTGPGTSLGPIFWSPFSSIDIPCLRPRGAGFGFSASPGCMEVFGGHVRQHLYRCSLYPFIYFLEPGDFPGISLGDCAQVPSSYGLHRPPRAWPRQWSLFQRDPQTLALVSLPLLHTGDRSQRRVESLAFIQLLSSRLSLKFFEAKGFSSPIQV